MNDPLMQFFSYAHLPPVTSRASASISKQVSGRKLYGTLPLNVVADGRTRKLLEAGLHGQGAAIHRPTGREQVW